MSNFKRHDEPPFELEKEQPRTANARPVQSDNDAGQRDGMNNMNASRAEAASQALDRWRDGVDVILASVAPRFGVVNALDTMLSRILYRRECRECGAVLPVWLQVERAPRHSPLKSAERKRLCEACDALFDATDFDAAGLKQYGCDSLYGLLSSRLDHYERKHSRALYGRTR